MLKLVTPADPPATDAGKPTDGARYWAFLSYSHHDKAIAKKLQKQLETYRVPKRLVGRETSHGAVPARMSPVFRDRDELHAGADLKASVQEALSRSRWLIVVCTPDSARSPWVNREIIEFKKLHGERRVLALIVRGEPFASDKAGMEAQECFPPALRRALDEAGEPTGAPLEPIAADMRKEGDGPHRAMLKLVAGMLGVPFDDLVRRDVQRRVRWLTALASASAVGVVVFAFLAVMAVRARNEAQHQRQQAEGLIEFMLGDLRKKLEPVGRLEVLDSVGEKALAYYGEQGADTLDASALGHRSRAMHLIGEIQDRRGNPAEAQKAFEQAAATTAQLLEQSPNNGQRIFDHAQSVFWVGYAAWKRADGETAMDKLQEYRELAERLMRIDPANDGWRAEVAFARQSIGTVEFGIGKPEDALSSLEAANKLFGELVPTHPELLQEVAKGHGWRADALELLGRYQQAAEEQQQRLLVLRSMTSAKLDRNIQIEELSALHSMGVYALALGQIQLAKTNVRQAMEGAAVLVARDPENLRWRAHECSSRLRLAEIELAQGNRVSAKSEFAKASQCVSYYNSAGTTGVRDSIQIRARYLRVAAELIEENGARQALAKDMLTFLDEAEPRVAEGAVERMKLAVELANVALSLGAMQPDSASANVQWKRAERLLVPFSTFDESSMLTALARARFNMGDVAGAKALARRVALGGYRHPLYVHLLADLRVPIGGVSGVVITPGGRS